MRLFVGLGNPGKEYEDTRHNLGRRVVEEFAKKANASFSFSRRFNAFVANGSVKDMQVSCLLPETYMNASGDALVKYMQYYKVDKEAIVVVVDDADLPFGTLRLRSAGSAGGHNGLKSIEEAIGTREYMRLRCGIGRTKEDLKDHVLCRFSSEEEKELPSLIERGVECLMTIGEPPKGEKTE